jgi:FtsZ-binding cell division protein ZapB
MMIEKPELKFTPEETQHWNQEIWTTFYGLIKQSNAHETALSKFTERVEAIEAKAQGKGFFPPGIVERLEEIDSRLTGLHNDSVLYSQEWAKITRRLKALEYHSHGYRDAHGYLVETEGQTYRQSPDLSGYCGKYKPVGVRVTTEVPVDQHAGFVPVSPAQGSYICDNCKKDWVEEDLFPLGIKMAGEAPYCCILGMGGCGKRAVIWHPAQTVGKPAEVPTSSVEPKEYSEGAENQSGTLKACPLCGNTGRLLQEGRDYQVACTICTAAETPYFRDKVDAIAAWNCRPIEDELRQKLADMEIEYDRSEREREEAVAEIATLKAENEQLKHEDRGTRNVLKGFCEDDAPLHDKAACVAHEVAALREENERLKKGQRETNDKLKVAYSDLAAAQKRIDNALIIARANLTYYEEDPECAPIRVTCVPVDLRRIIAALDEVKDGQTTEGKEKDYYISKRDPMAWRCENR